MMEKYKTWEDIKDKIISIPNLMSPGQAKFLFNKVRQTHDNATIVEIGSFNGCTSVAMGYACVGMNRKLFCIDMWCEKSKHYCPFSVWQQNIVKNGLEKYVIPLKGKSQEILPHWKEITGIEKVDFIFIDGSHEYKDVLQDFIFSYSLLGEGGSLAMHDVIGENFATASHSGPWKVWNEIALYLLVERDYCSSLVCGKKQ